MIVLVYFFKTEDCICNAFLERLEGRYYPVSLERRPLLKGYVEGAFGIALVPEVLCSSDTEKIAVSAHAYQG